MTAVLTELRRRLPRLVDDLAALVSVETPTEDVPGNRAGLELVSALARELVGDAGTVVEAGGRPHLRIGPERPGVLLLGHVDTVWPGGTLARWAFDCRDDVATGPGVFDMKAGVVEALHAMSLLDDLGDVALLATSDEETGSLSSRALIEATARRARAVLVLEPSAGGALKTARKGVSMYRLDVTGRAAHAGLEPERGANATVALAALVQALPAIASPELGTTVTPTLLAAGTTGNTVPARGRLHVDVRVTRAAEQQRVDDAIRKLDPGVDGVSLAVEGGPNRPPFDVAVAAGLFATAVALGAGLGLGALEQVAVGGGSDGNFTAALGVPTLDGLGPVGDHAHAEGEWVRVSTIAERGALLHGLVAASEGKAAARPTR